MKRNLLNVAMFGLLAVAMPASTFVSCKDYDEEFATIKAQMQSDKEALQKADTEILAKIAGIETQIKSIESNIAALKSQQDINTAAIKKNAEDIAKLNAAVEALQKADADIKKLIADLENNKVDKTTYAADLQKINAGIEAAQKAAKEAKTAAQIADGKAVSAQATADNALAKAKEGIAAAAAAAEAAKVADGKATKAQAELDAYKKVTDATLATQAKTLEEYGKQLKALAEADAKLAKELDVERKRIDALIKEVAEVRKIAEAAATKEELKQAVAQLRAEIKDLEKRHGARLDVLEGADGLKSLVFQPEYYYAGIEAMETPILAYPALTVKAVTADGNHGADAPVAGDAVTLAPGMSATYHINPSYAAISENVANYKFVVLNRDYRAAAETIQPNIYKATVDAGKVTVRANFTKAHLVKNIFDDAMVTVMALQYTEKGEKGDTTVTSDYAALRVSKYDAFKIVNPDQTAKYNHTNAPQNVLYGTAPIAINENPTVLVEWDDEDGINLLQHVATIANENGAVQELDENGLDNEIKKYGMRYDFQLVGYQKGVNKTSETAQIALDPKTGSIVRAQNTINGKQAPYGSPQNVSTTGRQPLVRVTLTDTINNKIAAVGYIKLEITQKVKTIDFPFTHNSPYTAYCGTNGFTIGKLQWHDVQEDILSKINMSREEFANTYEPELDGANFVQFVEAKGESQPVAVANKFGLVSLVSEPVNGVTTDVIKWTVANDVAYPFFKQGGTKKTIHVRFKVKAGHTAEHKYVYVTLTWDPSAINANPGVSLSNNDKINNYWFNHNTNTNPAAGAATGFDEMHANVDVMGETAANVENFKLNLLNGFVGNTVKFSGVGAGTTYPNVDQPTSEFVFIPAKVMTVNGHSGATYTLSISTDGKTLKATKAGVTQEVAKINGSEVDLQRTDFAMDLLNNAPHNELADNKTFTARLAVKSQFCAPIGDLNVGNSAFDVKFLRPISVNTAKDAFTDSHQGVLELALKAKLAFTDWREKAVDQALFNYYKITKIEQNGDITTDLNGGKLGVTKLADVSNNVIVKFVPKTPSVTFNDFGKITYENNNAVVKEFTVRVPLVVTYAWGKLYTHCDATVRRTVQNARGK